MCFFSVCVWRIERKPDCIPPVIPDRFLVHPAPAQLQVGLSLYMLSPHMCKSTGMCLTTAVHSGPLYSTEITPNLENGGKGSTREGKRGRVGEGWRRDGGDGCQPTCQQFNLHSDGI